MATQLTLVGGSMVRGRTRLLVDRRAKRVSVGRVEDRDAGVARVAVTVFDDVRPVTVFLTMEQAGLVGRVLSDLAGGVPDEYVRW